MKAIGFDNFRKFERFPTIQMGNITIFVGGNNSGKSTTVKAIISVLAFLRNARFYASGNVKQYRNVHFYFNQDPYAHIGTFVRAKCNKNDRKDLSFEIQLEDYKFSIYLNGEDCDENSTYAKVERIVLRDLSTLFEFDINFKEDSVAFSFNNNIKLFENNDSYISMVKKINEKEEKGDETERLKAMLFGKYPIVDEKHVFKAKLSEVYSKRRMVGGPLISSIFLTHHICILIE